MESSSPDILTEALTAQCIERIQRDGWGAADQLLEEKPEHAELVRQRLQQLARLGFLPERQQQPLENFGQYQIERQLGAGGMGLVYRARDTETDRWVALKIMSPQFQDEASFRGRFQREMRAIAALDHPGVVKILDVGEEQGAPFFSMGLIEGLTLGDLVTRLRRAGGSDLDSHSLWQELFPGQEPPWPAESCSRMAARIVASLAEAVQHTHERGVLHRDLKPTNVMLKPDGGVVLFDFGLAALADAPAVTATGELFGTPQYFSPEHLGRSAGPLNERTDVYGLGVILYELVCLRAPYEGSPHQVMHQLARVAPEPLTSAPADLRAVVDRAMERQPERRYGSAQALGEDLRRLLNGESPLARPLSPVRRAARLFSRHRLIGTTVLLMTALLLCGWGASLAALNRAQDARGEIQAEVGSQRVVSGEKQMLLDEINRRFRFMDRVSDRLVIQELLELEDELYPSHPEMAARLGAWLVQRDAVAQRLDVTESLLKQWTANTSTPSQERPPPWMVAELQALLHDWKSVVEHTDSVRGRHQWAKTILERSVDQHHEQWQRAVEQTAASPAYGGLSLRPQVGLVPLGLDPASGLQEFWHMESGAAPERHPITGRWDMTEASGLVLVLLPPGTFLMGLPAEASPRPIPEPLAESAGPVHPVELEAFFLSRYEMTQGQWLRLLGENPSYHAASEEGATAVTLAHPVETMNWTSAMEALRRLGLTLPTEAQWEYAARAKTQTLWVHGDDPSGIEQFANLNHTAPSMFLRLEDHGPVKPIEDGHSIHAPVGSFLPNAFGLHDMSGNVAEWCRDASTSYSDHPLVNLQGIRVEADTPLHALRGAGFGLGVLDAHLARRANEGDSYKTPYAGLRPSRKWER